VDIDATWGAVATQRRALADLLDRLDDEQWETPSLCDGWRVREVAAHVAMAPTPPGLVEMITLAIRHRGDFNELNYFLGIDRGNAPTAAIVASLREHADSRKLPIVTNCRNINFDILVHTQDIAMPLGMEVPMPLDSAHAAAEHISRAGWPFYVKRRFSGVRLVADDVAFEFGSGPEVRGPVSALLLLMSGRGAAVASKLSGDGRALVSV
jgi:uncharacterized protein (TIGR03083 family)